MYSLNQIINRTRTFQEDHQQLASFFFGDISEYNTGTGGLYYALTCVPLASPLVERQETFSFQFGVWGKVNNDLSNEVEVLSDTKQICKDLITFFKNNPDFNNPDFGVLRIDFPITLEPAMKKFDDDVAGTYFNININQFNDLDFCAIPFVESGTVLGTENGFALATEGGNLIGI